MGRDHRLIRADNEDEKVPHLPLSLACDPVASLSAFFAKLRVGRLVGRRKCAYQHVHSPQRWKDVKPYDLPHLPFHAVPLHGTVRVSRHNDSRTRMRQEGSDVPNFEVSGPEPLALLAYRLELSLPRQPPRAWKAVAIRRRRILRGV